MPTIVELPNQTEVEFPDGMDQLAIHREIVKAFPELGEPVPSERSAVPDPGYVPSVRSSRVTSTVLGAPAPREESILQEISDQPMLREQAAMQPTVQLGQPATIPRFGEPGTMSRGISEIISGLGEFALNRPEEVAASLYPPTAAAIALRYTPEIGKQWLEDVYKGFKGDKEAAGRASAMLFAVGGPLAVKRGLGAVKRAQADVAYQAQYRALVDRMAREGFSETVGERQTPFSQISMEPAPGRDVLVPKARYLTEEEAQRLILSPEQQRTDAELAAAERHALLPKSSEELSKFTGGTETVEEPPAPVGKVEPAGATLEENKPPAAALRETPQTEAPTAATVSEAEPPGVAAPGEPPAISQATTEPQTAQPDVTESIVSEVRDVLSKSGIPLHRFKVFGSVRRGQATPKSDIDIAITVPPELRSQADSVLGNMAWQDTIKAKYGRFPDIHVKESTRKPAEPSPAAPAEPTPAPSADELRTRLRSKQDQVISTAERLGMVKDIPISDVQVGAPSINDLKRQIFPEFESSIDAFLANHPEEPLSPPAKAAAKVESQVKKVARTEGQRPAKEVKNELVDRLEGAAKEAPFNTEDYFDGLYVYEARTLSETTRLTDRPVEGTVPLKVWLDRPMTKNDKTPNRDTAMGGKFMEEALNRKKVSKVTIDIPGDGTFTVWNTKDALQGLADRAKRISTSTTDPKQFTESKPTHEQGKLWMQEAKTEPPAQGPVMVGMGGATAEEFTGPGTATAMKYRRIDQERIQRGLEPLTRPDSRTDQEVWDRAMAAIDADPALPDRMIAELRGKARPITDLENHVLLLRKIDLRNDYGRATRDIAQAFEDGREEDLVAAKARRAELSDKLTELEEASRVSGSERGRALRSLRVMADEEFNLAAMESDMRASVGGRRLTPQEMSEVERIKKEYDAKTAALDKQVQESERRRVEAETRATLAEVGRQAAEAAKPPSHIMRIVEKIGQALHSRADAARARLRGKLFTLSPEVLKDLAEVGADNIFTVGEEFAKWSAKMIEDIGEHVRPHLQAVWDAAKKLYDDTIEATVGAGSKKPSRPKDVELAKQTIKKGDTAEQNIPKLTARIEKKFTEGKANGITPQVQQLARAFVEQGIRDREELIDAVHEVVAKLAPEDWTRRDTMDAISGYGDYKALTKDEISVKLRDLKGQMQQLAKLEDMAAKQAPLRTGLERRVPTRAESELIKLVNEAKRKGGYQTTDPTKQLRTELDEVKKRTETAIYDYEKRLREQDFAVRKPTPIRPDSELLQKQADLKRVRKEWEQAKRDHELANRYKWQKVLDKFVRWERAFKLSSPVVFGKLSAAAVTRAFTTTAEEGVGAGLGLVPGIRTIAKQAPREGGFNVKAMSHAITEAVTKGMKDAWETAKAGASSLDVVYGEKLIDRDWANVFGQLHGMLKAPVKRAEFTLSLEKRIQHAMRNGIDVTDPIVMTRLMTEALSDGYRSIFMQRGFSSDMFNTLVGIMEKSKKYQPIGEISARTLRFLLPVVRVPINIVSETATGIHGVATASARTMFHVIGGTLDKLEPVTADSIMRQFKKGSIGLGLMAVGYFAPNMAGGYDWREKRKPGAVKTGGFQIMGVDVPRWLTHAPWFELMQFGATIRHVKDQHVGKTNATKGISEGMWAAGLGLLEETPFIGQMLRVDRIFEGQQARSDYLGELLKGTVVPQALSKIAELNDTSDKRKPKTIWEHVEMGIPGLRQRVPIKTEKSRIR